MDNTGMDEMEQMFGVSMTEAERSESVPNDVTPSNPYVESDASQSEKESSTTPMNALAHYVMARFRENYDFRKRSGVSEKLDSRLHAQTCSFSSEQIDKMIRAGFPKSVADKLFAPITSTKIRAAKSMLIDLANQSGEPLFRIEPTPDPDVPQEVTDQTMAEIEADITSLFYQLQQNGVQELPPDAMNKLQRVIAMSVSESADRISNAKNAYARIRAKRMERKVWDTMLEGGWNKAFEDYIDNICTYGTGIIVGPIPRAVAKNKCVEKKDKDGRSIGVKKYERVLKTSLVYESINPQDCYPAPDAQDVSDGAFCITVKYTADELWRYCDTCAKKEEKRNGDGWMERIVRSMLARHPRGGVKLNAENFDPERRFCENNGTEDTADCTFEGVRCFASVRGSELASMGITKTRAGKRIELNGFYRTETIVIDNQVVYCRLYDDVLGVPISKGVFYTLPGSWWGEAIADKVAMAQCVLNNCIKSLMNNMPASSGAIYWVNDVQRLADKSPDALKLRAGKTIPFVQSLTGNQGAPIGSITVPSNASELLGVWKAMQTQADMDSGIPAFTEGQSSGQGSALRTASGLAIYTEASTRGMKMVMTTTDKYAIANVVRLTADYILLNDDDMTLKGDVEIKPVGLIGKILKAQRDQQRLQLFNMVITNQFLLQLCGPKGVVSLFRPSLMDVDINPDDVIPSEEKLKEMELINGIKQVFEATQASQGVAQNAAQQPEQQGAGPGVQQPPTVQGGVAERRGVA